MLIKIKKNCLHISLIYIINLTNLSNILNIIKIYDRPYYYNNKLFVYIIRIFIRLMY